MGSIGRRLAKLEASGKKGEGPLTREALRFLSDEDLQALEEALETEVAAGEGEWERLYAAVKEQGRRALDAYFEALEAARRGEEPPPQPGTPKAPGGVEEVFELWQRAEAGDEEAKREVAGRSAYRIWKYRNREKGQRA